MRGNDLLDKMELADDEYVEAAYSKPVHRKHIWMKWGSMAACACFIAIGAFACFYFNALWQPEQGDNSNTVAEGNPDRPDSKTGGNEAGKEDHTEVYYSSLVAMNDEGNLEKDHSTNEWEISIQEFDESMLEDACAIVEGKITGVYLKTYEYSIVNGTSEENGSLDYKENTCVYEVEIVKSWYGEWEAGSTILVENKQFFTEGLFAMQAGHTYVLPIYEAGDKIAGYDSEIIKGDIWRDSVYSVLYAFHPQIEVTSHGYIVSDDWKTLVSGENVSIIMDIELGENEGHFKTRMRLVQKDVFAERMEYLLNNPVTGQNYETGESDFNDAEKEEGVTEAQADIDGTYHEAVQSSDLSKDTAQFFGGSYLDDNGSFVIVLTEDTEENRAAICKELGISETETKFETGSYSLAYLTQLQEKITDGMINKELSFVSSSGIYEAANRIKVSVTTTDEAVLEKLYALDTIGGAIEVEHSSGFVKEDLLPKAE